MEVQCWNCDFFNTLNEGNDNSGQCRRHAPRGIDSKSIPDNETSDAVFPEISDGTTEFCGEFKPNTGDIPAAV